MAKIRDNSAKSDWEFNTPVILADLKKFGRKFIVAAMYWAACEMAAVPYPKSLLVFLAVLVIQFTNIGARRIPQIGLLFVLVAGLAWLEVPQLQNLEKSATSQISSWLHR